MNTMRNFLLISQQTAVAIDGFCPLHLANDSHISHFNMQMYSFQCFIPMNVLNLN